MKKYLKVLKKKRFYIFILCLGIFLLLAILILKNDALKIDTASYEIIKKYLIKESITPYIRFFTNLGGGIFLILISLLSIIFFQNKKFSLAIIINLILVFIFNQGLKLIFQRERPLMDIRLINEIGYSFPSGHSMVSMAFYGFLIYLIYVYVNEKKYKFPLIIFLSLIILFIGLSRIYLGVHYLSDVLAGFLIAICYLIVFVFIFHRIIKTDDIKTKN